MPDEGQDSREPSTENLREDLKSEYDKVFELKQRLDTKAAGMITLSGVIAAVFSGFGTFLLKDILNPNPVLFALTLGVMIIELILLIATIHHAHRATKITAYNHVLFWEYFIDKDKSTGETPAFKEDKLSNFKKLTKQEYDDWLIRDYLKETKHNVEKNQYKVNCIKDAEKTFALAIVTIAIFAVLVIFTDLLA
jgi:hypothetical protein